ncbi:MBL fold metallo-hydrolase RNA specificity domain-containing protein [Syntrophomonas wolfei]|uniref:MBL fold metallo-hydrolase RNA specificity domain-containing protein n=1 Tax=Syntrophomonas wolfei TaxID=863 RepID=UPI0023F54E94|nr:MBL fold metallo-hydrolase [Syntrophomonas wolfei]
MKLKFLGAAKTVTGSCFLVETGDFRFAVDCGLFQGSKSLQQRNYKEFPVDPASINFIILTHAHIDHSGLIPKLCKNGFTGPIYCSQITEQLCQVLLPDSGYIQESEVERKNRKLKRSGLKLLEPIYTAQDALNCLPQFRPLNTDEIIKINCHISIRLRTAGHILGARIVEVWVEEECKKSKLVFSGDLGNINQPLVKDPSIIESADYLIIESTYGNRLHDDSMDRADQLLQVINETMAKGGNLIIPAFAVERTQDLIYDLIMLGYEKKLDPNMQIYIDSPLAIAATEIFVKNRDSYEDNTRAFMTKGDPWQYINLNLTRTREESMHLNDCVNKSIIISASGMCEAGRIKHHLKHNLWRPESTILFVGYQAAGTLGRRILDGEEIVTIHGEKVAVKADIRRIEAYSAHADRNGLIDWLMSFVVKPRDIFIVHGEEEAQLALAEAIQQKLNVPIFIPDWLQEFELIAREEEVRPSYVHSSRELSEAVKAEQMYLQVSLKLNEMFRENWTRGNYAKIIEAMQNISSIVD